VLTKHFVASVEHRLFVNDDRTGQRFLVDSGAYISVLPYRGNYNRNHRNSDIKLIAANGSQIKTFGPKQLHLDLGFKRLFTWIFELADVARPILGADFLHYCGLLVDVRRHHLVDLSSSLSVHASPAVNTPPVMVCTVALPSKWSSLLLDYSEVTRESPDPTKFLHDVVH